MTAHAEWKYHDSREDYDSYVDYSKIKTEGRYKSMWVLTDFKSLQTDSAIQYKSMVRKVFIDCQGSRYQVIAYYRYSMQMTKGDTLDSDIYQFKESNWRYGVPNSIGDGYIQVACTTNSNPKPPPSNTQDSKRQRCINLGLVPNSADFQQCIK